MKRGTKIFLSLIIFIAITLFLIRLISPREIDDVNPLRDCQDNYLNKSQILWIMPFYQNISIAQNQSWCKKILSLNKTLELHGITHEYHEFELQNITQEQLDNAIKIFQDCFNQTPTMFKAPYLKLSKENKKLLKENNMKIRTPYHQTIHKFYHCSDSGTFPNWFHNIF